MNLSANRARLTALTKDLLVQWRQTKEHWRDAKSEEFEHLYLDELLANVDAATGVIEQLELLVNKIRNDCE